MKLPTGCASPVVPCRVDSSNACASPAPWPSDPRVLLMDEPCSALDPTSTRRIETTIEELRTEVTIVIVTHNMQQAQRVSDYTAFFLAEQGTPGYIIEHGPTDAMFDSPLDPADPRLRPRALWLTESAGVPLSVPRRRPST